jgi:hypothetical protein
VLLREALRVGDFLVYPYAKLVRLLCNVQDKKEISRKETLSWLPGAKAFGIA